MTFAAAFLAGLTDSYNPCSVGVLLVSLSILVGLRKPKLIWLFGLSYLSSIFITYLLIGLGILRAFHWFGIHNFFGYVAAIVLVLAGLIHLFPSLFPNSRIVRWIRSCHVPVSVKKELDKGVFLAGIILGFLIGICNLPCAGGVYLGTISLLSLKTTYWKGMESLIIFNIGFILPLVCVFFLATRPGILEILRKSVAKFARYGTIITSTLMILMGISMVWLLVRVM